MRLFVTIYEETADAAIQAIRSLRGDHDGVEVRAERFPSIALGALRAATAKPIILTYRGGRAPDIAAAVDAGIDYVDVEWHEGIDVGRFADRIVLSHHDYEGMRDVERIWAAMRAQRCALTKLAATPRTFADNERLLALLPGTVIGMGERGLYSRILAPFLGSELAFVAATNLAAPGQLTLEQAREIYGNEPRRAERVFAIAGNPAGHSRSPLIHNRLFREKGVPGAYTIASFESFAEIADGFLRGEPAGLSVTAPFKEDAFAFATAQRAEIGDNARRARAVNTLVNVRGTIVADNTDVDGFRELLSGTRGKVAIVGAGATARAARVALEDLRILSTMFNRTVEKADAPLSALPGFGADVIINTLPPHAEVEIPRCETYFEAAYAGPPRAVDAVHRIGGLDLLRAQAVRQNELFMRVFDGI
jgi:3-dehydroquinate dehydratase type I